MPAEHAQYIMNLYSKPQHHIRFEPLSDSQSSPASNTWAMRGTSSRRSSEPQAPVEGGWKSASRLSSGELHELLEPAGCHFFPSSFNRLRTPCSCGMLGRMKTAIAEQVPQQWPQILEWVTAGEEVQVTHQDKIVARLLPSVPVAAPDFLARAKAVWGDAPAGTPLSQMVSEARGGAA
jgi:antitoxin (DNA-binding transcriptional repressor) of toxin-antitoxin stability system